MILAAMAVLALVLVGAVRRPGGLPEAAIAVPGALLLVVTGVEPWPDGRHAMAQLGSTVAFLAAVLVLAEVTSAAGLFDAAGALLTRTGQGGDRRFVSAVALLAVAVTTVLSLDATIVLFTPVVIRAVRGRAGRVADASLLATVFLANGGSMFLPVANLTNLLVVQREGIGFGRFFTLMAVPGLISSGVITASCCRLVPRTVPSRSRREQSPREAAPRAAPVPVMLDRAGLVVAGGLAVLLGGCFVASTVGVAPAWVAVAGALILGVGVLVAGRVGPAALARATKPDFLLFVLALAVVVDGVARHGAGRWLADRVPQGDGLVALLVVALLAMVAANVVNNLPATLLLLPVLHGRPTPLVLAALLGLNIGPNLTYPGSLATLLWRRIVRDEHVEPAARTFLRTGLLAGPAALASAVVALWVVTRLV